MADHSYTPLRSPIIVSFTELVQKELFILQEFGLSFSMVLSPPVPEHYRRYAASGRFRKLK